MFMCFCFESQTNRFECLVTVFKWIKHEKEENKMKKENAGNFCKPAKIFARVAKFHNPCKKIS